MKILSVLTTIFLILVFATVKSEDVNFLTSQSTPITPLIVQYIPTFKVGTNDLTRALNNQYKNIIISDVKTSYVEIHNSIITLTYMGNSKKVQNITALKVKVSNDSFKANVTFQAKSLHIVGSKNYTCYTTISELFVNYAKQVDFETGNTIVEQLSNSFSPKSFSTAVCKQAFVNKDKDRIQQAINAQAGSSIYLQLKKVFDGMQKIFSDNIKDEHLSQVYETNPYSYDYYGFKININVSTTQATKFGGNGVKNEMLGTIANTTHIPTSSPAYEQGYSAFYSLEFIQNMIEYSRFSYPGWKNIKVWRQNMRTRVFKFRLIDFEYIVPSVLQKYPKNYLSDVIFYCSVIQMGSSIIDDDQLYQDLKWKCRGSFQVTPGTIEPFIDADIAIRYKITFMIAETRLDPRVDEVSQAGIFFNQIGNYQIIDTGLASLYVDEGLFEFRGYTIGSFFKVNSPKSLIKLVPEVGIWVG